jgi:WhiB family transcriptional regulator, redox-sensing transcriptional regulator
MWERAACAGLDTEDFFAAPDDQPAIDAAKAVCAACEVRGPCLEYAITGELTVGVWGGLTAQERMRVAREGRRRSRLEPSRSAVGS